MGVSVVSAACDIPPLAARLLSFGVRAAGAALVGGALAARELPPDPLPRFYVSAMVDTGRQQGG